MNTFWILVAVLASNSIDPTLFPYQVVYKTKAECTKARLAIIARAKENNFAIVSACIEKEAV